jgi:hypothetical protein
MAERNVQRKFLYEGAAARYRALMIKTCDPARRRMLAEMIARELEMRRDLFLTPVSKTRLGGGGIETA